MREEFQDHFEPLQWWLQAEPWKEVRWSGLTGLKGSSKAYLLSRWREKQRGPLLVVVPHLRDAETFLEDFRFFRGGHGDECLLFPPWETLPYADIPPHPEIVRERVRTLYALAKEEDRVIVAPIKAL